MFKLESYITPLLIGYIDKYVKLNKEDFQLSLWGGDVVLNKVDLRLDVIEEAISLPISFKSGFIHELRIHVPWTRIYSEAVVITVNTIECVLKLRGSPNDDVETASSKSDSSVAKRPSVQPIRAAKIDEEDLPPGYLQSLINKIINNVNIVINNLILKFVEDDIVLSLNVKSAECYSVDGDWTRSFIELSLPDLMLRRILDLHDLTVCLDKRNADGKIESYQDPVFYRCALMMRILTHYESMNSKLPQLVKLNVLCEKLDMSLTNVQLPMFYRLIDLCMALYYGTIEIPEEAKKVPQNVPSSETVMVEDEEDPQQSDQGWVSWMWSYVPSVLPGDGSMDDPDNVDGGKLSKKPDAAVFAVGVYVTEASVLLKMYELVQSRSMFAAVKLVAKPFLLWKFTNICMEMKMRGENFTDVQFGIRDSNLSVVNRISHHTDIESSKDKGEIFFKCNRDPLKEFHLTYISGSLFDGESPENNGQISEFVFDEIEYLEKYNEAAALDRFGIFWMSYLFTSTEKKEQTLIRFLIGPSHLLVSSIPVGRVMRVVNILLNLEHEFYYKPTKSVSESELKSPSEEDLEKFSHTAVTVIYRLNVHRFLITVYQADGSGQIFGGASQRDVKKTKSVECLMPVNNQPALVVQADRIQMELTMPSCARLILECGLKPPSSAVDDCYSQLSLEVKKLEAGMTKTSGSSSSSLLLPLKTILQPCDVQFSKRNLLFPELWRNSMQPHSEIFVEIRESATLSLTKPQLLLLVQFINSWMKPVSGNVASLVESIMDDVFIGSDSKMVDPTSVPQSYPVIEFSIADLDVHLIQAEALRALTATVGALKMYLFSSENGNDFTIPLLIGPLDSSAVVSRSLFRSSRAAQHLQESKDHLIKFTFQIPNDTAIIQAPGVLYLECGSVVGCLDPRLHEWLAYRPLQKDLYSGNEDLGISLNHNIANATLPLIPSSPLGSESDISATESGESRASFRGSQGQTLSSNRVSKMSIDKRVPSVEPVKLDDSSVIQDAVSWGACFSGIFPFIKMLELQVSIDNWCVFLPTHPLHILEPSQDISAMFCDQFDRHCLPDTLVLCCPSVYINSAGHQKSDACPEIPIKSLQHSIASEKLPWMISLQNCSIYTVLQSRAVWNLLKPMSVGATFVAIPKYQMLPAENMSQLGLCIHTDLDTIIVRCSNQQFHVMNKILAEILSSMSEFASSLNLALGQNSSEPTVTNTSNPPQDIRLVSLKSNVETSVFDSTVLTSESDITRTLSEGGTSTDVKLEELGTTRLTFWLQFTLTKLSVQLFEHDVTQREICIKSDLEDVTMAADIQDVYSKVKCKVGGICISHYSKAEDIWSTGDHEGILVFCTHQFKMHGPVLYHRNWKPHEFFSESPASGESRNTVRHAHGFLDIVYTRARTENAARRLGETFHAWTNSEKPSKRAYSVGVAYLEEICVTLQPLSVVFHGPVIAAVLGVFSLPALNETSNQQGEVSSSVLESEHSASPVLNSRNMPLVNLDVREFSLFCPDFCSGRVTESFDDVCILHVGSLKVTPQPDNPLPRVVIEKSIYQSALQAGITSCPGSEVEDRQYQLDICGFEVCSSSWDDLVNYGKNLQKFTHSSNIQNPAFEWNTVSMSGISDEVRVCPLLVGSDLRVVFAPAMVSGSTDELGQVVCGYSLEINATSDLEFYLTVDQIGLLHRIADSNVSRTQKANEHSVSAKASTLDSFNTNSPFEHLQHCTQFDVLLTGSKISVMLYSHEIAGQSTGAVREDCVSNDSPSAVAPSYKVMPFLFLTFSQPHLIISCQKIELSCYDLMLNGSGCAMSGATANRVVPVYSDFTVHWLETKPGKPDPNTGILTSFCTIALTHYMTTSAKLQVSLGRPLKLLVDSQKIRQLLDFMMRINSALAIDAVLDNDTSSTQLPEVSMARPVDSNDKGLDIILEAGCSWLKSIDVNTVQLVFLAEFGSNDEKQPREENSSAVILAFSGVNAAVSSFPERPDQLQRIVLEVVLRDTVVKTGLRGSFTRLIGPVSLSCAVTSVVMKSLGFPSWRRFIAFLSCSNIQVDVCRDNLISLEYTSQHLKVLLKELVPVNRSSEEGCHKICNESKSVSSAVSIEEFTCKSAMHVAETYDDLKAEFFNYLNAEKSGSVPNPGEILFFSDADVGRATMTWRYFEPRVLTSVKAMQVPFSIQRHHSAAAFDETLKVPCTLQYSLSLGETFEDYSEFFLSQNQSSQADLPDITAAGLSWMVAAEIWRVVIHMPPNEEHLSEEVELLVSPLTLAASLRVDSVFVPELLPVFHLTSRIDCAEIRLFNQSAHLSKVESGLLSPFRLLGELPKREVCVAALENFTLTASYCGSKQDQLHAKVHANILCHVLEYRSLTLLPLVEKFDLLSEVTFKSSEKHQKLKVDVELDKVFFRISPSVVQTISDVMLSWQQIHSTNPCLLSYYIICNNTNEALHFGQVDTDEDIVLQCLEGCPYSWRCFKAQQLIRVAVKGSPLSSSTNFVDISRREVFCVSVMSQSGQPATLIVRIVQIGSALKQVVINGLVFFANQIDRPLSVKILSKNSAKEVIVAVSQGKTSPSCIADLGDIRSFKLSTTTSSESGWSPEIPLSDALNGVLVKVPLTQPTESLYIWCHVLCQNHGDFTEAMVAFCPLYVVRSHFPKRLLMNLNFLKLKTSTQLELEGHGVEKQLEVDRRDHFCSITFQTNATSKASSPSLTLSTDTIEQVDRVGLADLGGLNISILEMLSLWKNSENDDFWPYNNIHQSLSSTQHACQNDPLFKAQFTSPASSNGAVGMPEFHDEQPDIELHVNLTQLWPGFNTLLVDVSPRWLVVNESGLDIVLMETDNETYKLSSGRTVAPPVFKESFQVGVVLGGRVHLSKEIRLSSEEQGTSYAHHDTGILFLKGHIPVFIPVYHDGLLIQHCFLTLHSTFRHGIRVITIRERFHFVNRSQFDLQLYITTVESTKSQKVFIPDDPIATFTTLGRKEAAEKPESSHSLLLWNVLQAGGSADPNAEYVPHVRFKLQDSKPGGVTTPDSRHSLWSFPIQLNFCPTGTRHSVALPCLDGPYPTTKTCVLSAVLDSEIVYLVLDDDFYPSIELINNCNIALFYGQAVLNRGANDATVLEETGVISNVPCVRPRSSCHYTPPYVNALFPEIHDKLNSIKLHLGAMNNKEKIVWSHALEVFSDQSIFVVISKVLDLKVDVKRCGHVVHVRVNPVSRAEVSAKEIRSRIKGKSVVQVEEVSRPRRKKSVTRLASESGSESKEPLELSGAGQSSISGDFIREEVMANAMHVEASLFCKEAGVLISDELPNAALSSIMCITFDEIGIILVPKIDFAQPNNYDSQNLFVSIYDLQIDNPAFATGFYDFPVILKRSQVSSGVSVSRVDSIMSEKMKLLHDSAMVLVSAELYHDLNSSAASLQTLRIAFEPLMLFVEDTYCWDLLRIVDRLAPSFLFANSESRQSATDQLPVNVKQLTTSLASPIWLQSLCIEPTSIQLSIHASLKLFISSDRAPLNFGSFGRKLIFTNSQQLFRALAMHYAVSAAYRAALVFGSLEILGNPTGFVRSIGSGVADMIWLPYEGLTKGPGPCISGFGGGMRSVARHFSAGTLTSITNFASSISRNMERLSLDSEHILRNEITRRRRPSGISEGLINGLSGFGLSVLGAIAGIADQPLQTFTRVDQATSTSDKAKGVVSGFGKGLLGMVTKPIGGAAEFVSQTSLGLLQGIGLVDAFQPRYDPGGCPVMAKKVGAARYHEKILHLSSTDEILFHVNGCEMIGKKSSCVCALVLTASNLYVLNEEQEDCLCTFPIAEISLKKQELHDGSPRLVLLHGNEESNHTRNSGRLAAFIDDTTHAMTSAFRATDDWKFPKTTPIATETVHTKHEFCLDSRSIDIFIAWFVLAKGRHRRNNFPL